MARKDLLKLLVVFSVGIILGALIFGLPLLVGAQGPVNSSFSYQGRLLKVGQYVNNVTCDFQFSLYTAPSGGTQIGSLQTVSAVAVRDGYFTVNLDFGDVFQGSERYLQINVRCPPDTIFTSLGGRVLLQAAPYSQYAQKAPWSGLAGIPAGFADGIDDGVTSAQAIEVGDVAGGDLTGTYPNPQIAANAVGAAEIADGSVGAAEIADGSVGAAEIADGSVGAAEIADGSVGMAELNVPVDNAGSSDPSTALIAGDNYFYGGGVTFTPPVAGRCLVTTTALVQTTNGNNSSLAYVRTAREENGSSSNDSTFGFYFSPLTNNNYGTVTMSYVWNVTAGRATRFGCFVNGSGDFVGDTLRCRTTYFCQ